MKRHILAICAIALAALAANAGTLTVTHTEQGKLSDEVAAAVAADETLATAADITELKIIGSALIDKDDLVWVKTDLKSTLLKLDMKESAGFTKEWGYETMPATLQGMTELQEVILPPTMISLKTSAFDGLKKLKTVEIPASVKTIKQYAFRNCESFNLEQLPPELKTIEDYAFDGCKAMTLNGTELPSTIETIKEYAFQNCPVTFSVLPEKLKEIKQYTFKGSKVSFSEIPSSVTSLYDYAFAGTKVTFTTLPESLKSVGVGVFQSVKTMDEFTIPNICNLWTTIPKAFFFIQNDDVERVFTCRAPSAPSATISIGTSTWIGSFSAVEDNQHTTMKVLASAKASFENTAPYSSMKLEVLTTEVPEPELILAEGVEDSHVSVKFVVADADHTDFSKVYEGEGKFVVSFSDDAHEGCHVASIRYSDAASYAPRRAEAEEVEGEDPAEEDPDLLYAVDSKIDNLKKTIEVPVTVAPGMRQLSVEVGRLTDEQISGVRQAACTAKAAVKRCGNDIYVTVAGAALYDTAGRCVLSTTGNCLSVESLPAGCYILRAHGTAAKIIR